jgi:hypothetical protein
MRPVKCRENTKRLHNGQSIAAKRIVQDVSLKYLFDSPSVPAFVMPV